MPLITVTAETSITPPIAVDETAIIGSGKGGGAADTGGLSIPSASGLFLRVIRPKVTIHSDLVGTRTIAPYGNPLPWQIGLALMFLGIAYIGHLIWMLFRKV